jgi:hypothetical protein
MRKLSWVTGVAVVAAAMASGTSARAHGEEVEKGGGGGSTEGSASASAGVGAGADEHREGEGEEEEEKKGEAFLDLVLGWGKVPFAVQNLPGSPMNPNQTITYSAADAVPSNVQSIIAGGEYEVAEHIAVGLRIPLTFAGFSPDNQTGRATTSLGNIELEGAYEMHINRALEVSGGLGLALPTASGDEIPPDLMNAPAGTVDSTAYDRFSLSRAAASARGYEDNALFEPQRFGIIPKVEAEYHWMKKLTAAAYVKLENLIGTKNTSDTAYHRYIGELVPGIRAGYKIIPQVEPAFRAWLNATFAGSDEDKKTSVAIEPQVIGHLGGFEPYAGVIVPVAGPPQTNGFVGVRIGVAGRF